MAQRESSEIVMESFTSRFGFYLSGANRQQILAIESYEIYIN